MRPRISYESKRSHFTRTYHQNSLLEGLVLHNSQMIRQAAIDEVLILPVRICFDDAEVIGN